jgi:hypothetical protein
VALLRVAASGLRVPDAEAAYSSVVTAFALLASTGALAGVGGTPAAADALDWSGPEPVSGGLEWEFEGCAFDERAAVIAAQLFLLSHEAHPVRLVSLTARGGATPTPLHRDPRLADPYPPVWQPVPFPFSIDPDLYDAVTLRVKFVRPPDSDESATIDGRIMSWSAATAMGAYGVAPVSPRDCSALFDESVILIDDELELPITKMRAHRSCLHGLVNVCIAIHQTVLPILDLSIE